MDIKIIIRWKAVAYYIELLLWYCAVLLSGRHYAIITALNLLINAYKLHITYMYKKTLKNNLHKTIN